MGKFYSYFFFLLLPFFASAQLYIGKNTTNSYVYNKGEIIYVTENVQLEGAANLTEGNFYMREEGQLIQGDNASNNQGAGVLSIYQENTRDAWDYHMWISPVGDQNLTTTSIRYS
mgnify:FL=1